MTSKISCSKMITNAMKRRLWYGAVAFLIFFIGFPLVAMLSFQSKADIASTTLSVTEKAERLKWEQTGFVQFLGGGNYGMMALVAFVALLGAWCGLYWLHSRKKMDLIGSLPVKREKLFLTESLATLVLFFVPYLVNLILAVLVGLSKQILTGRAVKMMFAGVAIHLLYFVVLYLCAAIAMLLTGKLLTGILGTGVFLVIGPVTYWVLQSMPMIFWKTYVEGAISKTDLLEYTSVAGNFLVTTTRMFEYLEGTAEGVRLLIPMVTAIAAGVVFAALCIWLVKKRPTEGAEHSMAFPQTEGVIKACILYVLGLGGGLFFLMLGAFRNSEGNNIWFWFGIVFSLILGSIIIEVIYHFDRKMLLGHKAWTGISMAAVLFTAIFFAFDLPGYDQWVPDESEVTNATMLSESVHFNYPDGSKTTAEYLEKHLDEMHGEGLTELAAEGVKNIDTLEQGTYVTMYFKMQNGSVKKRQYLLDDTEVAKEKVKLYKEEAYKAAMFPMLLDETAYEPESVTYMNSEKTLMVLTQENKEKLTAIYCKELEQLDYLQIHAPESGAIWFANKHGYGESYYSCHYNINENFPATIEFLEENGIRLMKSLEEAEILSMEFYDETGDFEKEAAKEAKITTDQEFIKGASKNLIYTNQYEENNALWNLDESISVWVTYRTLDGDVVNRICYYEKGKVPDVVKKYLQK